MSMFGRKYSENSAQFSDGQVITDKQIAKFVKNHTTWLQRLDYHFVSDCATTAFTILSGAIDMSKLKGKNWKFGKDFKF